jgi:hypothetical protein
MRPIAGDVKGFTRYFETIRVRPDRAMIRSDWIQLVVEHPAREVIQADGRIRRWAPIQEMQGRYFDRSFTR